MSELPQELLVEILLRLPAEDLAKFTAVCKSWNSVIKNPNFISTHLQKTISCTNLLLFRHCTFRTSEKRYRVEYSLRLDNKALDEYKQLPIFPDIGGCLFRVAGSYNGLVCLVKDMESSYYGYTYNTFILWNPAIKKAIRLPEPSVRFGSHGRTFNGFGFDLKTNDYKLLRFVVLDDKEPNVEVEAEVYSLNANCWTSITSIAPNYIPRIDYPRNYGNSFVNGAIHMLACDRKCGRKRNLILAFDLSEEVFSEIPFPDHLSNALYLPAQLLKYRQSSIAIMTWERDPSLETHLWVIELWVMKEYGVATSWTKVLTKAAESVPRLLFFRQEEQVLVARKGGWIASIDIKSKQSEVFGVQSLESFLVVDSYVESLVLLDKCCIKSRWDVISIDEDDANSTQE
ncbi:hypothetical protein COLO4_03443 [Corchorus olitorius]|uniref:F-box domain-containing protein n=1 Tax=Corchorus olitorius TaxID=93759 RepID=A0A1R3KYK1_9ROSI|nr:hypothetical protein COLO4_03443 [Corchorus olitorius]